MFVCDMFVIVYSNLTPNVIQQPNFCTKITYLRNNSMSEGKTNKKNKALCLKHLKTAICLQAP